MEKTESEAADPSRSIYLLVEKLKEANAAISRLLSDAAAQLGQGEPRLQIISGSTYGYSGTVADQPEYWIKEYLGFVMGPESQTSGKVPSNVAIACVQYHHEDIIDRAELWFAIGKTQDVKSLADPSYWISVRAVKYWSDPSLPAYGEWSPEKSITMPRHGAMTFKMARQPLSALQDSTVVGKVVVEPMRRQWTNLKSGER